MKKNKLISCLLVSLISVSVAGCGNKDNSRNKNNGKDYNDVILDHNNVIDDLEFEADGSFNYEYLDNVEINVWNVIGDPDLYTLEQLVKKFNDEYQGYIKINLQSQSEETYYGSLETKFVHDFNNFPDVCLMHNEVNIEYAVRGYFYPLDDLIERANTGFSYDNAYDNIERTTILDDRHFGIPIDAHGYLMNFRQDIIKKNGLGFDNNTRYTPNSYSEYQKLLEDLRAKADSGELWVRNINLNEDHSWYQLKNGNSKLAPNSVVNKDNFYPSFMQTTEFDALTALYVNGGSLQDENGDVNFHKNAGLEKYITDGVNRYNNRLMGGGLKTSLFGPGNIVMFAEGPWWVANTYSVDWNNAQLGKVGEKGVTEEDANDPVYRYPYAVARPQSWYTVEGAPEETASKWYGNGHVLTITQKVTSLAKVAATLVFAEWLTQGKDKNGEYNLATWCKAGHIPAWKNVYDSNEYKTAVENSMTLKALGDPADIIALEGSRYASTLISGVINSVGNVHGLLESNQGCTVDNAKQILNDVANATQDSIDLITFA